MTKVQQRTIALLAAFALAIGCVLAFAAPQQQAEAKEYQLVSGSTFARATNLPYSNLKSLTVTNKATFNTTNDNNFYKFTTSNRNSRYKITLQSFSADYLNIVVYDSGHHRFYSTAGTSSKTSFTLAKLKRNSTYYIEVWRYAVDSPYFVDTPYADYKLSLKEVITKPQRVNGFTATSSKTKKLTVKYNYTKSFNAEGYQIKYIRSWEKKSSSKRNWYRHTTKTKYTFGVAYHGKKYPYQVQVRPYRKVNGKYYYGPWAKKTTTSKSTVRKVYIK